MFIQHIVVFVSFPMNWTFQNRASFIPRKAAHKTSITANSAIMATAFCIEKLITETSMVCNTRTLVSGFTVLNISSTFVIFSYPKLVFANHCIFYQTYVGSSVPISTFCPNSTAFIYTQNGSMFSNINSNLSTCFSV